MKKFFVLLVALAAQNNFAQNVFPATGNVGIGTNAPSVPLEVKNGNNSYGTVLATGSEYSFSLYAKTLTTFPINSESFRLGLKYTTDENNGFISFYRGDSSAGGFLGFSTNGIERIRISKTGNVGIGTQSPSAPLTVWGVSHFFPARIGSGDARSLEITSNASNPSYINNDYPVILKTGGGNQPLILDAARIGIGTPNPDSKLDVSTDMPSQGRYDAQKWSVKNDNYDLRLQTIWNANAINQEFIQRYNGVNYTSLAFYKGKIGIGTSNPDEQLTVNGKIHAKEVRIDLSSPMTVPDYVFANDYKLKSLQEVEAYIKQNSHLPEIPSAKEIEKNGLMLAEMNMALLKKIEELTLYVIEQEKKNTLQSKEIDILKKENQNFQLIVERVIKLENQSK